MEVERTWIHGDHVIFKFKGVDTISGRRASGRRRSVHPDSSSARPCPEARYYQSDLVGCDVVRSGGSSSEPCPGWQETGGVPFWKYEHQDGKELLIPFAKASARNIDLGTAANRGQPPRRPGPTKHCSSRSFAAKMVFTSSPSSRNFSRALSARRGRQSRRVRTDRNPDSRSAQLDA